MSTDQAHVQDQIDAAMAEVRSRMAVAFGAPDGPQPGIAPMADELWERYAGAYRCDHLQGRPIQPWYLVAWEGTWRCEPCLGSWMEAGGGRGQLSPMEEQTCDRCRRYSPSGLRPAVLRQDLWVIMASLCRRCADEALAQVAP